MIVVQDGALRLTGDFGNGGKDFRILIREVVRLGVDGDTDGHATGLEGSDGMDDISESLGRLGRELGDGGESGEVRLAGNIERRGGRLRLELAMGKPMLNEADEERRGAGGEREAWHAATDLEPGLFGVCNVAADAIEKTVAFQYHRGIGMNQGFWDKGKPAQKGTPRHGHDDDPLPRDQPFRLRGPENDDIPRLLVGDLKTGGGDDVKIFEE